MPYSQGAMAERRKSKRWKRLVGWYILIVGGLALASNFLSVVIACTGTGGEAPCFDAARIYFGARSLIPLLLVGWAHSGCATTRPIRASIADGGAYEPLRVGHGHPHYGLHPRDATPLVDNAEQSPGDAKPRPADPPRRVLQGAGAGSERRSALGDARGARENRGPASQAEGRAPSSVPGDCRPRPRPRQIRLTHYQPFDRRIEPHHSRAEVWRVPLNCRASLPTSEPCSLAVPRTPASPAFKSGCRWSRKAGRTWPEHLTRAGEGVAEGQALDW